MTLTPDRSESAVPEQPPVEPSGPDEPATDAAGHAGQ